MNVSGVLHPDPGLHHCVTNRACVTLGYNSVFCTFKTADRRQVNALCGRKTQRREADEIADRTTGCVIWRPTAPAGARKVFDSRQVLGSPCDPLQLHDSVFPSVAFAVTRCSSDLNLQPVCNRQRMAIYTGHAPELLFADSQACVAGNSYSRAFCGTPARISRI